MDQETSSGTVPLLERSLEAAEADSVRFHIRQALQIAVGERDGNRDG